MFWRDILKPGQIIIAGLFSDNYNSLSVTPLQDQINTPD